MHSRTCLALLALLPLTLLGCASTTGGGGITIKTGNMVVTVVPKLLTQPKLLITYDSGSGNIFTAYLDATGEGFEIKAKDGWYALEDVTAIVVENAGGEHRIVLKDSTGKLPELASTVTKLESEFVANSASGDWDGYDPATGLHDFALYILFKDSIHLIEVRAKG